MIRIPRLGAATAAALLALASSASAAPTAQEAASSMAFLVGTWHCAHMVGDFSGTYTEQFERTMGGRWLKQSYDFPATQQEPAVHAEYFFEYDPRGAGRWIRFGAHSNGQYYGMRSTSTGETGWAWEYVLPAPGASATWTKKSENEYTIDGPSYPENGRTVTEHHDCKKTR